MCDDTRKETSGDKAVQRALSPLPSSIYHNELPFGSPVSKSMTRIRFLPRELPDGVSTPSAMSSATMETHVLDVESPGATLERKVTSSGYLCDFLGGRAEKRREPCFFFTTGQSRQSYSDREKVEIRSTGCKRERSSCQVLRARS